MSYKVEGEVVEFGRKDGKERIVLSFGGEETISFYPCHERLFKCIEKNILYKDVTLYIEDGMIDKIYMNHQCVTGE